MRYLTSFRSTIRRHWKMWNRRSVPCSVCHSMCSFQPLQWIEEILEYCPGVKVRSVFFLPEVRTNQAPSSWYSLVCTSFLLRNELFVSWFPALKCDLRDDPNVKERLARYGAHTVQYEEGLDVARRIRASRYLGACLKKFPFDSAIYLFLWAIECSAKHNRGVTEVFYEAARVSISARTKGQGGGGCVIC